MPESIKRMYNRKWLLAPKCPPSQCSGWKRVRLAMTIASIGGFFSALGRNKGKVERRMALLGADAPLLFMVSRMRPTGEKVEEPKRAPDLAKALIQANKIQRTLPPQCFINIILFVSWRVPSCFFTFTLTYAYTLRYFVYCAGWGRPLCVRRDCVASRHPMRLDQHRSRVAKVYFPRFARGGGEDAGA